MKPEWIKNGPVVQKYWSANLQTLEGHSDNVNSVAFSADGKQVVSGSEPSRSTSVRVRSTRQEQSATTAKPFFGSSHFGFCECSLKEVARL